MWKKYSRGNPVKENTRYRHYQLSCGLYNFTKIGHCSHTKGLFQRKMFFSLQIWPKKSFRKKKKETLLEGIGCFLLWGEIQQSQKVEVLIIVGNRKQSEKTKTVCLHSWMQKFCQVLNYSHEKRYFSFQSAGTERCRWMIKLKKK